MRQIKNCKVGHFVKYQGILCQLNCFFTDRWRGEKKATLTPCVEIGKPKRLYTINQTEKVEYIGETASQDGMLWVRAKSKNPFE